MATRALDAGSMSLSNVLAMLGYTHEPGGFQARRVLRGRVEVFRGNYTDTVEWLRRTGQIA